MCATKPSLSGDRGSVIGVSIWLCAARSKSVLLSLMFP
jgi:hypothetical protein